MKFSLVQDSRKGGRPYNQDRVAHCRVADSLLMVLADGLGGYAGGELAAQTAVDSVADLFRAQAKPCLPDPMSFLPGAIGSAHETIVQKGRQAGLGDLPRSTLVACVVQGGCAFWSHIGDSRLYVIRAGRVLARTKDHSVVQQLIDAGRMREEAIGAHPDRNQLLQSLGGATQPKPSPVARAQLARHDIVLICSDGLWGPLTPQRLLAGFIGKDPARALPDLMAVAEERAGADCDNVSALALHWDASAR